MLRLILGLAAVLIVIASLSSRLSEIFTPGAASAQALQSYIGVKGKKQGQFKGATPGSSSSQATSGAATKPAAISSRRR
jgi:hypothetical protein